MSESKSDIDCYFSTNDFLFVTKQRTKTWIFIYSKKSRITDTMNIGGIEIKGKVILGPMAGITSLPYREFNKPFGVALSYSEMISDCGLAYGNKRTFEYFATSSIDRPVGLQLFGSDIAISRKAISILEEHADYDILDLNLGCPVNKVTKTGAGSAMLKSPDTLYKYVRAMVEASHKPVTAKIRLGWDDNSINVFTVAKLLEDAGCKMFTVHARTSKQMYSGHADYEKIRSLNEHVNIPFAISGDIFSPETAKQAMDITGASFVMVARGAVGRPNLIKDINDYLATGSHDSAPSVLEALNWARDFSNRLIAYEGERIAVMQLRGIVPHFFNGFPGYKRIREAISSNVKTKEDLEKIFHSVETRGVL